LSKTSRELLVVENLVKHYPVRSQSISGIFGRKREFVHAVDGVGFSIKYNETFAVVGESGSGKSTLGLVILRLVDPTSGEISFKGVDIARLSKAQFRKLRSDMQIVLQDPSSSLDPRRRVFDSISEPLRAGGLHDKGTIMAKVSEAMKAVGLSKSQMNMYPHQFSGGQRQRISIARAIVQRPKLIVLDEPTSSLDVSVQSQIMLLLQRIQSEFELSYLLITHNISVAKYLADRIGVMYLGKIVELGTSRHVVENPMHPYSQLLISSVLEPSVHTRLSETEAFGEVPNAINPPSGCRFRTRCPYAKEKCLEEEPSLREIEEAHFVACHFAEEISQQRSQTSHSS
jgi:oligopeptide transport system ATP-binding protein